MRLLFNKKIKIPLVAGAIFLTVLALVFGTVFSLTANVASATRNPDDELLYTTPDDSRSYYKDSKHGSCYYEDKKDTRFQINVDCGSIEGQKSTWEKTLGFLGDLRAAGIKLAALLTLGFIVDVIANFLFIISNFLGLVITLLILGMGWFVNGPASEGIQAAWKIIRDIANIGIVGGLVATAIGTIIQSTKYNINVTLAKLIIAALLVNFSFFFAGALIDIANVTTVAVYTSSICAPGVDCATNPGKGFVKRVFNAVKFKTVADEGGKVILAAETESVKTGSIVYNLFLAMFMLIVGFYLLQVIFLLLVRFVALIFLLITSPAGIAGLAIPLLKDYVGEWWKALYTQAVFPIVFFLLTGVALTIVESLHTAILQQTQQTAGGDASVGFFGQVISFTIAFAFLSIALRIARQLSEQATWFKGAYDWMNKNVAKPAGQFYQLPLTAGLRNTVGLVSDKALNWYNNRIAPTLRKVPVLEGLDRGIQGTLKAGKDLKPLGAKSYQEVKTARQARDIEIRDREKEMKQRKEADGAVKDLDKAQKQFDKDFKYENRKQKTDPNGNLLYLDENGAPTTEAKGPKGQKREAAIESMTELQARLEKEKGPNGVSLKDAELKLKSALADLPPGTVERWFDENPKLLPKYAAGLSEQQFLEAMESKKIPEDLKSQMREVRHGEYMNLVRGLQKDVDEGRILEGSDEYKDRGAQLFNYAKWKLRSQKEFVDLVVSETGKDMRGMRALWGGSTNGMYTAVQNSPQLSEEEKYSIIRPLKQKGYIDTMDGWSGAEMIKGRGGALPYNPDDDVDAQRDARAWARRVQERAKKVVAKDSKASDADKKKAARYIKFTDFVLSGARYETLSVDDKKLIDDLQIEFVQGMKDWYEGKQPNEVATEMLDRAMLHPLAAQGISVAQLEELKIEPVYMNPLRDNVLIGGDERVIQTLFFNEHLRKTYGWPANIAEIEAKRKAWAEKNGIPYKPLDQVIAEAPEAMKGGK